jgi:hypothetical protein
MSESLQKVAEKLSELIGPEGGCFGRVYTWGQRPTKYEYVGYELSEDILPTLLGMSSEKLANLNSVIVYFEIHARPLKELLRWEDKDRYDMIFCDIAWSHFMTVVMFGMLEVVVKGKKEADLKSKGRKIREFLEDNLTVRLKERVTRNYSVEKFFKYEKEIRTFSDVVDHMWNEVRSGFVHDAGIQAKGLEWITLEGKGTSNEPITMKKDVPMQEWLQITWTAILRSFGYAGELKISKLKPR